MSDEKKANPQQSKDKIEDLNQRPISDTDAQSVKGGMTSTIKEAKK